MSTEDWDIAAVRKHFLFPGEGRIVTNNAASTQPPRELLDMYRSLAPGYENVHRGQSDASQAMTRLFEDAYDTIAQFLGAPGRRTVALYRNTTEAINAVLYSLLTEFRDGDNVVTTMLEHNSNYVPWSALCRDILPRFGRRVECRLARFDPLTGELDLDHLASLIDARTKLVCCTGASNFLGTRPPLGTIRELAGASGYVQPNGEERSYLLVDGAQLVPGTFTDVQALGADYLAFSFHKLLAPFGIGVLYARGHLLETSLPFLYGGDMVAEGRVSAERVEYGALPWKYAAGTPNILGAIVSAQALRLLLDLALTPEQPTYFRTEKPIEPGAVEAAMGRVAAWNRGLTARALDRLASLPGLTVYGPRDPARRTSLVAFNVAGHDPHRLARALNDAGVESRAGCHCAALAHRALGLEASCRLSFYLYNAPGEVDQAVEALETVVTGRGQPRKEWQAASPGPAPDPDASTPATTSTEGTREDTMKDIGIVGTGIAGLHLALLLQQNRVEVTLYGEREPGGYADARLGNIVVRQAHTRARERALGVHHWDGPASDIPVWRYEIRAGRSLRFAGRQAYPASGVDLRLYESRLLQDFVDRGGQFRRGTHTASDLPGLARRHDLLVVATGRGGLSELFARDPLRSPYTAPQRLLIGGLFGGARLEAPLAFRQTITPGAGEILEIPQLSFGGTVMGLGVEAVPGGPLADFATATYGPGEFEAALTEVLREYGAPEFACVRPGTLHLTRPVDLVQGAVTPVVRRAYAELDGGAFALAVGDALAAHDPIVGQGANVASACAWALGEHILAAEAFDEVFCRGAEASLRALLRPSAEWTNSMLGPPTPQRLALSAACAADPEVAHAYAGLLGDAARMWEVMQNPQVFLAGFAPAVP